MTSSRRLDVFLSHSTSGQHSSSSTCLLYSLALFRQLIRVSYKHAENFCSCNNVFLVMIMIAFRKRQKEFSEILTTSSNLNPSRFFRLMALAGTEVLFGVPFAIAVIVINATHADIVPLDWNDVHRSTLLCSHCPRFCTQFCTFLVFWRVDQYPATIWKSDPVVHTSLQFTRWTTIICGLVFFAFFGFADEAQKHYKSAFESFAKRIGVSISSRDTTKINSVSSSFGCVFTRNVGCDVLTDKFVSEIADLDLNGKVCKEICQFTLLKKSTRSAFR